MQTLKTAFVVVLLLIVLYGAHSVLTQPDAKPPQEVAEAARQLPAELQLDEGTLDPNPRTDLDGGEPAAAPPDDLAIDAQPLAPPPSTLPPTSSRGLPSFDAASPADAETSSSNNSTAPPPLAAGPTIPHLAAQPPDTAAPSSPPEDASANAPPPSGGAAFAPATLSGQDPAAGPPTTSAFVPPAAETSNDGGFVPPAASPEGGSPAGAFVPPTDSGGGPGGSAFLPPPGAAPAASPNLPDPRDVARGLNSNLTQARDQANGLVNQATQFTQDAAGRAQEFTEGVRFDPKEALLSRSWKSAQDAIKTNNWRDALATLSATYEDPRLSHQERQRLLDSLDPLAARVIYSTEHLLEPAYEVRRGDTLMTVAEKYNVPWQLLRNINGVADPEFLVPGSKLKVLRGPFRADVDLATQEMTVYLQRLYAGRFPLGVGNDPAPRAGDYQIQRKELGRQYYAANGVVLPAGDVKNPYGRCWLDLGSDVSIHGTPLQGGGPTTSGCISLSPRDADDVLAILAVGSRVSIR